MAKSKVSKECIQAAAEALSLFTDSELSEYVTQIFNKARSYKDVSGQAALDRAQEEINNDQLQMMTSAARTLAEDASKHEENANLIANKKTDLRSLAIKRYKALGRTISGYRKAATEQLRQIAYGKIDAPHFDYMRNKKNQMSILRALDGKDATPEAKKIAAAIDEYNLKKKDNLVNSGAMQIETINDDRYLGMNHDSNKILVGERSVADAAKSVVKWDANANKPMWKAFIKSKLDLAKTFEHTDAMGLDGEVIHTRVDEILDDIFDNITQNVNDIFTKSRVVKGQREILKRRRMFFKFKDWESWGQYNDKYGTGDFFSALESDVQGSGARIGTAQILGSDPYRAWYDLKKVQQKTTPDNGKLLGRGQGWYNTTDIYFQNAMGGAATTNPGISTFFGNLKTAAAMAKLPLVTLASLADNAYVAAYGARWGMGYWKTYGYLLKNAFGLIPNEERSHVAKLFKGLADSELGFIGRFADANNSSEIMKKASMWFYRLNGLHAFDKSNKVGIMHLMATHLGRLSERSWGGLNDSLKRQLLKHDFTEKEWDILRQNSDKGLFTTDNVVNATDSQLREIWESTGKTLPLSQMRSNLYNKVFSVFDVASENAVLTPGEFEKAFIFRGTAPGSIPGEIMRALGFFKTYPIAYMDRVLINGFRDSVGSQAKFAWALQMMLGTLPLSVMGNYLTYFAKGLDFPDVSEMSPSELIKFGGENILGNLGVFLNITEARNQNKSLIASQFKTAPFELLGDMIAEPLALAGGHWKEAGKIFQDAAEHVLPLRTLPFIAPYMDGLLKHKPYLQPHQQVIYGYNH